MEVARQAPRPRLDKVDQVEAVEQPPSEILPSLNSVGLARQLPSRLEPRQDKLQPAQMEQSAIPRRSDLWLPPLVAAVVVVVGQPQATSTVDQEEGSVGRVEVRRALRRLQAGCRADQLRLVVWVGVELRPRTGRDTPVRMAEDPVATPYRRLQEAPAMAQSRAVLAVVLEGRPHQQTRIQSGGQAGPQDQRYLLQAVEAEQVELQPDRTGAQGRHQQAEPDRAGAVAPAMPQAQAGLVVTVGSGLEAGAVVVESLVVSVVEVVQAKLL